MNADPEMKELAAKSGFELVNVGVEQMDAFMKERSRSTAEEALHREDDDDQREADQVGDCTRIDERDPGDRQHRALERGRAPGAPSPESPRRSRRYPARR